jgi:peptidyl-prolyl cis-trans isomerase A (cyclophilin A)
MKKMYTAGIIAALLLLFSCGNNKNPKILIQTSLGNIDAELYADKAPVTVAAFLSYIDSGFFKNSSFYRVVYNDVFGNDDDAGVVQGGIWQSNNELAKKLPGIAHESPDKTGLSHVSGTLSLARTTAGSANTEFFICIADQTGFDDNKDLNPDGLGFAAFGKVTSGMDIIRKIHRQPANGDAFIKPVVILNIKSL